MRTCAPSRWSAFFCPLLIAAAGAPPNASRHAPPPQRAHVKGDVLTSDELPRLVVKPRSGLHYLGSFPFDIRGIAGGYRHVWGETDSGRHLSKVFIVQLEGYYPETSYSYDYTTPRPVVLGGEKYQHDVWVYDNDESARAQPGNESDLTKRFLRERGYLWQPELIMSRFARTVDDQRKNEIIFFYFENLKDHTSRPASSFSETDSDTEQKKILDAVDASSQRAFTVGH